MTTSKSQAMQDLEWAVGINRLSLRIFGTGKNTDRDSGWLSIASKLRTLPLILSILITALLPQTAALIRVWGHMVLMIDNMVSYILLSIIEIELITMWYKNEAIVTMMEYIKWDWIRPKSEQERDVMLRYGRLSRIITIGAYLVITLALVFYHSPVVFGFVLRTVTNLTDFGDRAFVVQTIYPFDAYKSPVFEIVAIGQFVTGSIGCFYYTTVSTLFGVIVLHVSSQLENLYNRIEEMGKGDNTDHFQIELKLNVKEHERLIRFSSMIESTFSLMLLAIVSGFSLMLCIVIYQTIIILGDDTQRSPIRIIFGIDYSLYVMFTAFVYSAVGDLLATKSEKIRYATYNCDWYKLKPREAAQLIPLLARSQRPLVITAGNFMNLTLPTFATIMKTTAGYVSFLLAVKD